MDSQQVTFVEAAGEHASLLDHVEPALRASGWSVSRWRGNEQPDVQLLMVDGACFEDVLNDAQLRVWRFTRTAATAVNA
jgi:hypothetical protein